MNASKKLAHILAIGHANYLCEMAGRIMKLDISKIENGYHSRINEIAATILSLTEAEYKAANASHKLVVPYADMVTLAKQI